MSKPLKIGAIVIGVVVGLIVLAIILAAIFIDPNRYRDDIVKVVKEQTGRNLKIEGKLGLSLFPWIGLETGHLELSNAKGFGPEPFARVDSSLIRVELLPLLRKQVAVDAVRLQGLRLHLARAANGRNNWDDLAQPKPAAQPAKPAAPAPAGGAAAFAAFSVNRLEVRNSEFTWQDQAAGTSYALRHVDLRSGNVLADKPAKFHLAFDLESSAPKITRRVELDAKLSVDPAKQTLNLPDLQLRSGDLKLQAQLRGRDVLDAPQLNGRVEVPAFNLRALLKELQIPYAPADSSALTKVGLAAQIDSTPKALSVSDLHVTLDDTQITGKFSQRRHSAPSYAFDFAVDSIDVDRYLPPPAATASGKKEEPKAEAAVVIPVALLRDTEAEGALRIRKLKAFGIHSEQISAKVSAHRGKIVLGPDEAKLYGGTYAGRTVIDASAATPHFQFAEKLAGVQIGPFLKDAGVFDRYSGTGNIDLKLTAQGLDATQIKRTLNGTAAIDFRDGKIEGVNLQKMMQEARAAYERARGKEVQTRPGAGDETAFKSLTATIHITNGVARNDDLKLAGAVVRASGSGSANLAQETIDYRLQVTVAEAADRAGTTLPLRIGGTFTQPQFRVDFSSLLKEKATKPLEKKLERKKSEEVEKLRNRFLEKLRR